MESNKCQVCYYSWSHIFSKKTISFSRQIIECSNFITNIEIFGQQYRKIFLNWVSWHSFFDKQELHLFYLFFFLRLNRQFPTSPEHFPPSLYPSSRYFAFHHQSQFFFQRQPVPAPPHPPSNDTDECDDVDDDDVDDDDEDDNSSILSVETKPTSSSLVKHSIENILSNKVTSKNKRPFSSFTICT